MELIVSKKTKHEAYKLKKGEINSPPSLEKATQLHSKFLKQTEWEVQKGYVISS